MISFSSTRGCSRGSGPKVFVAENVKGLTIGTAKGYFKLILRALKECGYRVKAAVLNAQNLGVPQSRERLIFIGVREDLNREPVYPKPLPYVYTLRDAFEGLENDPQEVARLLEGRAPLHLSLGRMPSEANPAPLPGPVPWFPRKSWAEGVMTLLEQEGFLSVFFNGGFEQVDNRLFHS